MDNNEFEKHYKELGINAQRRYPNEQLIQFLATNYFNIADKRRKEVKILELGCGSGGNLWMIAKEGFSAYGIDIAPTGIQFCQQMLENWSVEAELKVGNIKKIDYPDNYFDAVVDVLSVQHTDMAGHLECYNEVYRCLKPGGKFFQWHLGAHSISFTDGGGKKIDRLTIDQIRNPEVPYYNEKYNNGLICFLTSLDAEEMLRQTGFKNIKMENTLRTYKNMTQTIEYLAIQADK